MAADRLQALDRQFEPDGEQQEHHAEIGKHRHAGDVGDDTQGGRTDQGTGDQIAKHRAGAQPLKDRHHQHGCGQNDQDIVQVLAGGVHAYALE